MLALTEDRARFTLIALQAGMSLLVGIASIALQRGSVMIIAAFAGFFIYSALLYLHVRGSAEWASYLTVTVTTILTGIVIVLDSQIQANFTPAFFVPITLALILTGWQGILASGIGMLTFALAGIPQPNPYADPVRLGMIAIVIIGLATARIVLDSMRLRAENASAEATAAQQEAQREATLAQSRAAELEEKTREQAQLIDIIGTLELPMVPLADNLLLLPLVGIIDTRRIQTISSRLLRRIADERISTVIIDLAGVGTVDTKVAGYIQDLIQSIGLMGAKVYITGIRATVAQTMVELGIDMRSISIARTPQDILTTIAQTQRMN